MMLLYLLYESASVYSLFLNVFKTDSIKAEMKNSVLKVVVLKVKEEERANVFHLKAKQWCRIGLTGFILKPRRKNPKTKQKTLDRKNSETKKKKKKKKKRTLNTEA
ncbi:23.6 kDa heat shock protein [Pyrus ussuriensis x Pyrus communis]|uniref:23.6 kDa heat shock protein n=1 Tax=Pyrus ussuriensis x Pyrus communis TaxID=2448454 RepID=A0A5N5FUE9_9ROSA|nr:23.6 kDa heat shock protein [Pyrus ussuriensis x Pyrus communis]